MTEFEKMRNGEFYDFTSEECLASYYRAIPSDSLAVGNPCKVIRRL